MKKVLSLVLSLVLVLGLASVAFAAEGDVYDLTGEPTYSEDYVPGGVVKLPIKVTRAGETTLEDADRDDVRIDKLSVRVRSKKGAAAIKGAEIKIEDGKAHVEFSLVDPLVSIKDVEFEAEIVLLQNKKVVEGSKVITIAGKVGNNVYTAYKEDTPIYAEDGPVIDPSEFIRDAEIDAGNDVSLLGSLYKGTKVYVKATDGLTKEDQETLTKYPAIKDVKKIEVSGFTGDAKINSPVKMEVYIIDEDGNLKHVGNTNDKLPLAGTYYLADKELEIEGAVDETPEEETPGMGGDDALPNINDNPSTGR